MCLLALGNTRDSLAVRGQRPRGLTQKSQALPLGRGSLPSSTLSANMKKNSRSLVGWSCSKASGYRVMTRLRKSIPFCVRSGSLSGSVGRSARVKGLAWPRKFYVSLVPGSSLRRLRTHGSKEERHSRIWALGRLLRELTNEHIVLMVVPIMGLEGPFWVKNPMTKPGGNTNGPSSVSEKPARKMLHIVSITSPLRPKDWWIWLIIAMMWFWMT